MVFKTCINENSNLFESPIYDSPQHSFPLCIEWFCPLSRILVIWGNQNNGGRSDYCFVYFIFAGNDQAIME